MGIGLLVPGDAESDVLALVLALVMFVSVGEAVVPVHLCIIIPAAI
jgi:hypothetical protein